MKKIFDNLHYLCQIIWKFDKSIFITFVLVILLGAVSPYIVVLAPKYMLGAILHRADAREWLLIGLVFVLGGLAVYLLESVLAGRFKGHLSILRNGCFGDMLTEKMLKMKYELLEQPEIQELCFRANMLFWSDFSGMAGTFDSLKQLLSSVLTVVGFVMILVGLHPVLPLILALSIVVNAALMKKARNRENTLRPALEKEERERNYLNETMQDVAAGKDIRIYGLGGWLAGWYLRVTGEKEQITGQIQKEYQKADIWAAILAWIRDGATYGYLIYAMGNQMIAVDDFVMYLSCMTGFSATFILIIENFQKIRQFLVYTEDFKKAMELEEAGEEDAYTGEEPFAEIRMENVSFSYPGAEGKAVSDVSLKIRNGEHVAIVGMNGAGKTTLVKLLTGLYEPTEGIIKICDRDGKQIHSGNRFQMFSVVMQKIFQYAFSLEENITFTKAEMEDMEKLQKAIKVSGLTEEIQKLPEGLKTMLRKEYHPQGVQLSGGQAQKMALARAVYRNAQAVVLDEPTAALDPIAEMEFYSRFKTVFRDKTCVIISHRLSSVTTCDKIVLLDQGKIACVGSHEELLAGSRLYAKMWEAQSRPYRKGSGEK